MSEGSSRRVQLRRELQQSKQQNQGKTYLVVKDPVTRRYFRFTESQAAILELIQDPAVDAETVAAQASAKLETSISEATIQAFFNSLEAKHLLDTPQTREILNTMRGQQLEGRNLLYWKLASINPERVFDWLSPRTRWAFTPAFHAFTVVSILCGFLVSYLHWGGLMKAAPSLFTIHGLFLVWLVGFSVTTIHEFAHGLTCRHFGGQVHEVGFMLIYFQPAFYCDVSDSWMFPSKRNRMFVTLAGGYVQLVVWGICAVVWRVTDLDTFVNQIALIVILFSGLQTLVNFNPLIKLDGYYMLSDYLEIPNLRSKALASLWSWVSGKGKSPRPVREPRAQLVYAMLSMAFSTTLLVYVYSALYSWSTSRYALAGLVAFAMFSTVTLRKTAAESMAGFRAVVARTSTRKYRNWGIAAMAIFIAVVGHWELKIPAEFKILAREEAIVRAETEGVLEEMFVREGSIVKKGDVLARLRDFEKRERLSEVNGELQVKLSELADFRAGARPEELDLIEKLVETKRVEVSNSRRNQEQRNQLQETLARKRSELELDQQTLNRFEELFQKGLISRAELERAETAVKVRHGEIGEIEASVRVITETGDRESDLKTRELAEAESELRLLGAGKRPEQIRQLQAEVAKLESQVELLNEELERMEILAPIDGVVTTPRVHLQVKGFLESGAELCRIVDTTRVVAEMLVPEKELAEIKPGNPVWLKLRSFPTSDIQGRVDFIAPIAQTVDAQQMVVVRADLPNEDQILKPEMTGVAKIYCGELRIVDLMTRRFRRWVRTEFLHLLP